MLLKQMPPLIMTCWDDLTCVHVFRSGAQILISAFKFWQSPESLSDAGAHCSPDSLHQLNLCEGRCNIPGEKFLAEMALCKATPK